MYIKTNLVWKMMIWTWMLRILKLTVTMVIQIIKDKVMNIKNKMSYQIWITNSLHPAKYVN